MSREETPMVSVCVMTYNHEKYIRQCLDSIVEQQCSFTYEICIGEDESPDGTRAICQEYAERYPDLIRLFLRSRKDVVRIDGHLTGRFNFIHTLEAARGKYIALCEGDDYWIDPHKLQKQVDLMEQHSDCALTFSNLEIVCEGASGTYPGYLSDNTKQKLQPGQLLKPGRVSSPEEMAAINFIHTPSALFRNWIKDSGIPEFMWHTRVGDWPLHQCSAMHGNVRFLDEPLAAYRMHAGGVWSMKGNLSRIGATVQTVSKMVESKYYGPAITGKLESTLLDLFTGAWLTSIRANEKEAAMELYSIISKTLPDAAERVLEQLWEHSPRKKKKRRLFRLR